MSVLPEANLMAVLHLGIKAYQKEHQGQVIGAIHDMAAATTEEIVQLILHYRLSKCLKQTGTPINSTSFVKNSAPSYSTHKATRHTPLPNTYKNTLIHPNPAHWSGLAVKHHNQMSLTTVSQLRRAQVQLQHGLIPYSHILLSHGTDLGLNSELPRSIIGLTSD
ncbi:hypothetical protein FRB96_002048 [Tulasnella sp. 330]|nr:hypothetical protein FRB96_002048 [Tulasnella sp. 330]